MVKNELIPHLPAEILANIFSHLDNQDLVSCSRVSWPWFGEATRELWSREVDITSERILDSFLCSPQCSREQNAKNIRNMVFNADQENSYFKGAGKTLEDNGEDVICTYGSLVKVLSECLAMPQVRRLTLKTIWNVDAEGNSFENQRRIEELAFSTVGLRTKELVLEEIELLDYIEPMARPSTHFALGPHGITALTLVNQRTYDLAIEAMKWIPRLETFVWEASQRWRSDDRTDGTVWMLLLDSLSRYPRLKNVNITGISGEPGVIGNDLIQAETVSLANINDNMIETTLATFDLTVLKSLTVMLNGSSHVPLNLSARFDLLTLRHTRGISVLTELTLTRYPESTSHSKFGRLKAGTLIALARGNPQLQTLSLGSPAGKVLFQDIDDRAINAVARALPELRHFYAFSKVEGRYMTAQATISLGRHCRQLRSLSIDPSLDITGRRFMQKVKSLDVCLFPELEWLEIMRYVPKGPADAEAQAWELEATTREVENFNGMLEKHFPCLRRLDRFDEWRVFGCRWESEEAYPESLPVERFMSPYFWRNVSEELWL